MYEPPENVLLFGSIYNFDNNKYGLASVISITPNKKPETTLIIKLWDLRQARWILTVAFNCDFDYSDNDMTL